MERKGMRHEQKKTAKTAQHSAWFTEPDHKNRRKRHVVRRRMHVQIFLSKL